jgi:hypothetical protein
VKVAFEVSIPETVKAVAILAKSETPNLALGISSLASSMTQNERVAAMKMIGYQFAITKVEGGDR